MEQEIDYAEMLEIPVSTVNVVKKKRLFSRKPPEQPDDLKDMVVEQVNERMGAYVAAEDLTEPPKPARRRFAINFKKDKAGAVLLGEAIAVGALAVGIFLTNVFMPNSAINTFIASFSEEKTEEPAYTEFVLSPVVSERSAAEPVLDESGVLRFTAEGSVYPLCAGTVSGITEEEDGKYTVKISHTSSFTSVITGLTDVYPAPGAAVASGVPCGYSDGLGEVTVSMYDGEEILNCYTLMGVLPVWNAA